MTHGDLVFYDSPLSGHAHRARLMLSLLGLQHETRLIDLRNKEQKQDDFLRLNPFGTVPVLVHDGLAIWDSAAILVYLARTFDQEDVWLPADPAGEAAVQQWLSVAQGPLYRGPHTARLGVVFGFPVDVEAARTAAGRLLDQVETRLASSDWLAAPRATLADVAMYSYVAAAPQGGVSLDGHPGVTRWLARVEGLRGFVPMAGVAGQESA